jgi:Prokaryotic dksA/traR C4-type zinc finger
MREERTIHLVEIPIGGKDGFAWNRLHGEREEICEALIKEATAGRLNMQARLRRLDDALDRLMSGSYGYCSRCGRAIDDSQLEIDPAAALCHECRRGSAGDLVTEISTALQ